MEGIDTQIQEAPKYDKTDDTIVFGFWIYLMTDCVLFAALFAVYAVLHNNTFGGPSGSQIFSPHYVLIETLALLSSSFTCGIGLVSAYNMQKNRVIGWFSVTFLLGVSFVIMEIVEFAHLINVGNSFKRSAFLSSYFTLVGTHGLHVTVGLIGMLILMIRIYTKGLTKSSVRRLTLLSLFWHFLDIIWIFIFTIVYMMGIV